MLLILLCSASVPPVESGQGIIWEDAVLASQSTYSLPATSKSLFSTAESVIVSAYKTLFRPQLPFPKSRTIVVERPSSDAEVEDENPVLQDAGGGDDDSIMSPYTEGIVQPSSLPNTDLADEDTYHMGFMRTPEECMECDDHQDWSEESF